METVLLKIYFLYYKQSLLLPIQAVSIKQMKKKETENQVIDEIAFNL